MSRASIDQSPNFIEQGDGGVADVAEQAEVIGARHGHDRGVIARAGPRAHQRCGLIVKRRGFACAGREQRLRQTGSQPIQR
jgi:hypothetical protein